MAWTKKLQRSGEDLRWRMELCSASDFWGAHACGVLARAFCHRELLYCCHEGTSAGGKEKFVAAECRNQHAASVRSPEVPLALGSRTRLTKRHAKKNRITFRRSGRAMRWNGTRSRRALFYRSGFVS